MKNTLRKAACALLAVVLLASCGSKPGDFRNANWGDSISSVSKSEDTEYFFATDNLLGFNTKMYDMDAEILYTFKESKLSEAQCRFKVGDWVLADILPNYDALVKKLTAQYGAPLNSDYHVWRKGTADYEAHKDSTDIYAIYYKILAFKSEWKTETTYYSLSLEYADEQISYILYACPVEVAP